MAVLWESAAARRGHVNHQQQGGTGRGPGGQMSRHRHPEPSCRRGEHWVSRCTVWELERGRNRDEGRLWGESQLKLLCLKIKHAICRATDEYLISLITIGSFVGVHLPLISACIGREITLGGLWSGAREGGQMGGWLSGGHSGLDALTVTTAKPIRASPSIQFGLRTR